MDCRVGPGNDAEIGSGSAAHHAVKNGALRCVRGAAERGDHVNFKWIGPIGLLAALVIGDQIRINRPGHKYRLAVEVETPEGVKSSAGVLSVHPDRGYSRKGSTLTKGDAVWVDLGGGKNLVALLAHLDDKGVELDGMNFVALRAFNAAGRNTTFNAMNQMTGTAQVAGALVPVLAPSATSTIPPPCAWSSRMTWRQLTAKVLRFAASGSKRSLTAFGRSISADCSANR
jgi:hypothetical protein